MCLHNLRCVYYIGYFVTLLAMGIAGVNQLSHIICMLVIKHVYVHVRMTLQYMASDQTIIVLARFIHMYVYIITYMCMNLKL